MTSQDSATVTHCHGVSGRSSGWIDGMFIGIDEPTHSLSTGRDQEGPLLVALGPKFGTGQEGDVAKHPLIS